MLSPRTRLKLRLRILTAYVLLAVMCSGALGVPLVPLVSKDHSRPFPCQGSACACRDADACWQNCCCLSDREKLAWARQHGVEPPQFLVERVQQRWPNSSLLADTASSASSSKSCCAKPAKAQCCQPGSDEDAAAVRLADSPAPVGVALLGAQSRCQGWSYWIALISAAIVEVPRITSRGDLEPGEWVAIDSWQLASRCQRPAAPPPRV